MRIVVVTWRDLANPLAGGSEVVIDRLVRELKMRDHQVVLVCGGPVGPREYPVIEAGGTFSQYAIAPFVCRKRFRDWDLLVDVENGIPYFSPLWWKGPRLCLVHHVHTEQWRTRFGRVISAFGRWAEKTAMPFVYRNETFIAISESTETSLQKIGVEPDRIRVIHS
ncbi:MAG TPA: glycosyltransferase family 4 protein, partial [Acidimicrobiales bacterium]|nr:glycosyltransferase family 4 protein [Acidimicrobiales bacterium]